MQVFISVVNLILYSVWDWLNKILQAFGLSWTAIAVGLVVISVILRLFASNLVGTAVNIHHSRQDAGRQQRKQKRAERRSVGRGASTSSRKG